MTSFAVRPTLRRLLMRSLVAVILFACSGVSVPVGWAQSQSIDGHQQVQADIRGDDGQGKDGPLAKVGTQLAALYRSFEQHRQAKGNRPFHPSYYAQSVTAENRVAIDAIAMAQPTTLRADLEQAGLQQAAVAGRIVSGYLPIAALPEVAQLPSLRSAQVAVARVRTGRVTTQGDGALQADSARIQTGVTGVGSTVGVLSDSYATDASAATSVTEDIGSGDLPSSSRIQVLQDARGGTDEGRAMMQIIHDIAPGADLAFHTALGGQANFAQGIRDLADANANIIVDDIFYLTEPMFQDGVIAQAIDEVVDGGAAYFTAAGNSGRESYTSPFRSSAVFGPGGGILHDFGGGDVTQRITIPQSDSIQIAFQWVDPYASAGGDGARTDLDIYLLDRSGTVLESSLFDNNGAGARGATDPVELFTFTNDGSVDADDNGRPDEQFDLIIERVDGPAPERMQYIYYPGDDDPDDGPTVRVEEFDTRSPTIFGHSNAASASTVGAVFWFATPPFDNEFNNPFAVNPFSSVGGIPVYFRPDGAPLLAPDVRKKPNVIGPDGGNTTFFGQELNDGPDGEGDGFPNFFGTSAAAPHVAAVAALMLEFDPARAPAQIYADLEATALDMTQVLEDGEAVPIPGSTGFDFVSGYGLVQGDEAVPLNAAVTQFDAALTADGEQIELSWRETGQTGIAEYTVEQKRFNGAFEPVATIASEGADTYTISTDEVGLGIYTFRLQWTPSDGGTEQVSPTQPQVTVGLTAFSAAIDGEASNAVRLEWTVPVATPGYRYVVQQRTDGGFTAIASTAERATTVADLQPGRYDFRIRMEDEMGNAFSSEPASVNIGFDGAAVLGAPYPNPFTEQAVVPITLEREEFVTVRVYNTAGRLVEFFGQQLRANTPSIITITPDPGWTSGAYFVQVEGDTFSVDRRIVLVR